LPDQNLLLTGGPVEIAATGQPRSVVITAYSGGLMNVPGWGPLVIDLAGLDLSAPQVGILVDHDDSLNGIVGHGEAVVRDGKLLVAGTLAGTDAARQIIALAKTGFAGCHWSACPPVQALPSEATSFDIGPVSGVMGGTDGIQHHFSRDSMPGSVSMETAIPFALHPA
jgi:hypothetical protein